MAQALLGDRSGELHPSRSSVKIESIEDQGFLSREVLEARGRGHIGGFGAARADPGQSSVLIGDSVT